MLLTIDNNLQTKSFVKSKKHHYRFASSSDTIQIHNLEKKFCEENKIPPETIEGVKLFLDIGGVILVQSSYQEKVIGAFWIISIKDILFHNNEILKALPNNSPLKRLYLKGILRRFEPESFLIYSWTHSIDGKWFYRLILKWITNFYKDKLLYGFVLKENATAVDYYLKMGCKIIDELSNLYSTNDAHYILMYQTYQLKSLRSIQSLF